MIGSSNCANDVPPTSTILVEITSSGVVYAAISSNCIDKGIWRSPDGENWTKIIDGNFPGVYDRIALAINPNNIHEALIFQTQNMMFWYLQESR